MLIGKVIQFFLWNFYSPFYISHLIENSNHERVRYSASIELFSESMRVKVQKTPGFCEVWHYLMSSTITTVEIGFGSTLATVFWTNFSNDSLCCNDAFNQPSFALSYGSDSLLYLNSLEMRDFHIPESQASYLMSYPYSYHTRQVVIASNVLVQNDHGIWSSLHVFSPLLSKTSFWIFNFTVSLFTITGNVSRSKRIQSNTMLSTLW